MGSGRFVDRKTPGVLAGVTILLASALAILLLAGRASATHDSDGDGFPEESDNCPGIFNSDQFDFDRDGVGNTCDDSRGVPPTESWVIFYLKDENGRRIPSCAPVRWTVFVGAVQRSQESGCADFWNFRLVGTGTRMEIEETAPPTGCTGGLTSPTVHTFSAGSWRVVNVTHRCSTGGGGGTPSAPPTFTDTFAAVGQTKLHAVKISATTPVAVITVKWTDRRDRFDLSGIQNIRRTMAARPSAEEQTPEKLKITRRRTATSLTVRIEKLKPGSLKFKVLAKAVGARALVVTRVGLRAR
ncbi:MAG: hypothetical protein WKF41_03310 [Gaiellaceae bacterium]